MAVSAGAGAPGGAAAASAAGCWFWNDSKFWKDIAQESRFGNGRKDKAIRLRGAKTRNLNKNFSIRSGP